MASSRQMRRSRIPSPMNTSTHNQVPVKNELHAGLQTDSLLGEWVEPALRTPVPSFEDYKGLERHGVLEHMAPLGALPGHKVKARMRQHEPSRRAAHLKNGEARAAREEVNTPEPAPPVTVRRSEPRKLDSSLKMSSSRERDEDQDYDPRGFTRTTSAKAVTPIQSSFRRTSSSRPASGNGRLKEVVEQAAKRSAEIGSPDLGLAIKRLYDESLQQQTLADLLNAVLSQKQTPEQVAQFQDYVKAAKRQIKHGDNTVKRSSFSESVSKSPAKNGRTSFTRQFGNLNDPSNAPGLRHLPSNINARYQPDTMAVNGSPSKGERPSKRVKRSASASSDSSLSSLDSAVEEFAPENVESTLSINASNQKPSQLVTSSRGPRLGSFSTTKNYDPSKKSNATFHPNNEADEDHAAKRRKLQQGFHDFVVNESGIRSGPSSLKQPQTTPPVSVLSQRTHSRLRNGTVHRNRRYDDEALDSPTSSQGDLLIPPPPGASRGGTPNQLGRPPKAVKKAARIKMSPIKKRNGVTAGIARGADADGNPIGGGGRTDDNHDHENADVCSACSGSGQLLCCDGCDRAFHFTCLDPPMDPNNPPDGEWHCHDCMRKRAGLERKERGVFMHLSSDVSGKNPSAFNLPYMVRDYFDGVKTGEEGEYEEINVVKINRSRSGYEEPANNLRLKDGKENAILCFRCSKSALGGREILGCDFCNLSWHLDCLDPPLASGPNQKVVPGKQRPAWMCPNHLEGELARLDPPVAKTLKKSGSIKPVTGRPYHVRRPKNAKIIDIGLRRGFRNNGLIEIENELSEEEIEIEKETNGGMYRVQESGIKLDFIDRVKRARFAASLAPLKKSPTKYRSFGTQTSPTTISAATALQINLDSRPFAERKAALNLAQLAESDSSLNADTVKNLITTLTAEAPKEVEDLLTAAENQNASSTVGPLTEQEKNDLQALIDLAQRRLSGGN